MNPITEEYLAHHGILGMKWGIRRYQNKDGSLTPAGRKKMAKEQAREEKKMKPLSNAQRAKTMSDDELRSAITRMQLEQQYVGMLPKEKVSFGKKMVENFKDKAAKEIPDLVVSQGKKYLTNYLEKKLGANKEDVTNLNDLIGKDLSKISDKKIAAYTKRVGQEKVINDFLNKNKQSESESKSKRDDNNESDTTSKNDSSGKKESHTDYSDYKVVYDTHFVDDAARALPGPVKKNRKKK